MKTGKLILMPIPIAENAMQTIPQYVLPYLQDTFIFMVENIKTARQAIKKMYKEKDLDKCEFYELDKHSNYKFDENVLMQTFQGHNIILMSEAGTPCVADPGNRVVAVAHELNIEIVPLVGPNSILLTLMASGFNGQSFCFNGYVPFDNMVRKNKILQMETFVKKYNQTQLFMDTPYRNTKTFEEIIHFCNYKTLLCVATNLTAPNQFIKTLPMAEWKNQKPNLHKIPCIFAIGNR